MLEISIRPISSTENLKRCYRAQGTDNNTSYNGEWNGINENISNRRQASAAARYYEPACGKRFECLPCWIRMFTSKRVRVTVAWVFEKERRIW